MVLKYPIKLNSLQNLIVKTAKQTPEECYIEEAQSVVFADTGVDATNVDTYFHSILQSLTNLH